MLQAIEGYPFHPDLHYAGTPIYDELVLGFVWNVSYGDGIQHTAQIRAITDGPLEGVIVEGTDAATRATPPMGIQKPSPATMPAKVVRPEMRLRGRR
jgi:hypothetical protein